MSSEVYILSIDQGTTGTTALLFAINDKKPALVAKNTQQFPQYFPQAGWVEHDLGEIWRSATQAINNVLNEVKAKNSRFAVNKIAAIGITNQRETLCVVEAKSGKPLRKAIVWQCKRSTDICRRLRDQGLQHSVSEKTGLLLDPYFSGTKLTWLMENDDEVTRRLKAGKAKIGTIDTYLISQLTQGEVWASEASNASRTLFFDIRQGQYDSELLKIFGLPHESSLPELRDSASLFGRTKGLGFLPDGIPVTGVLGDQQAALAGQACFMPGEAKCTYGTGAFLMTNTGREAKRSATGQLTTVAWSLGGSLVYALEGSAFIAGAAVQYIRDQLGWLEEAGESERLARDVVASPQIYFVPALSGLGSPYWEPRAQGAFFGLTRDTSKAQLVRACLEGIAFQISDLLAAMQGDLAKPLSVLKVDGGACQNNFLMQIQADLSELVIDRPANIETTGTGAFFFAALGVGIVQDLGDLSHLRLSERSFMPIRNPDLPRMHAGWKRAVEAVRLFAAEA
jgi:glycerol kinase